MIRSMASSLQVDNYLRVDAIGGDHTGCVGWQVNEMTTKKVWPYRPSGGRHQLQREYYSGVGHRSVIPSFTSEIAGSRQCINSFCRNCLKSQDKYIYIKKYPMHEKHPCNSNIQTEILEINTAVSKPYLNPYFRLGRDVNARPRHLHPPKKSYS